MRPYNIEVEGYGWVWSGDIEAEDVSAAVRIAMDIILTALNGDPEIEVDEGSMRLSPYQELPDICRINGRRCEVFNHWDEDFGDHWEVKELHACDFVEVSGHLHAFV